MLKPPFIGAAEVLNFSIEEIMDKLDMQVLFKSRWKMAKGGEEMLADLLDDERILGFMDPKAMYGYFPAYRDEHRLIVCDEIIWEFPELKGKIISEYFKTKEEGGDIIPLIAVSIGEKAVALSKDMYEKNNYAEYFLLYGLAAECTETLAKMINNRINVELGINKSLRRSFGYPACPDLSYQGPLLKLLETDRISLRLSTSNQLIPEFSTTAFIIHTYSE
ncbi:MAG: vitamin B12 dependent-methionine synthase activation domain-containing protein [Candidatus Marinimicrobia bacterium]|nr:vitamin B12 dependent-methionine synthase activation domain-containing protein [Candidatus Neomarinimicrobiota bacterium]